MAKIICPNESYTGVAASVSFVDGKGETKDKDLITWFKANGYEVKNDDNWLIDYFLKEIENEILNFCNTKELPEQLRYILVRRAAGRFLLAKLSSNGLGESFDYSAAVKEIREGDVSISYADRADYKSIFITQISAMASFGEDELIGFRRLKW